MVSVTVAARTQVIDNSNDLYTKYGDEINIHVLCVCVCLEMPPTTDLHGCSHLILLKYFKFVTVVTTFVTVAAYDVS